MKFIPTVFIDFYWFLLISTETLIFRDMILLTSFFQSSDYILLRKACHSVYKCVWNACTEKQIAVFSILKLMYRKVTVYLKLRLWLGVLTATWLLSPPPPMTALYTVAIGFSLQYVNRQTVCINSAKEWLELVAHWPTVQMSPVYFSPKFKRDFV